MVHETKQSNDAKSVKVSGIVDSRFPPEFLNDIKTGQKQEHTRETNRFIVEIATLIVLLGYTTVAFWQGCSNQKAANAAKSAAETANNSLVTVQRAFLSVTTFDITRLVNPKTHTMDGSVRIAFNWQNGGDTPTKDMTAVVTSRWFPEKMLESYPLQEGMEGYPLKMFVGPKTFARSEPLEISSHDMLAIQNHTGHLYVWGVSHYRDVFGGTGIHTTMFCTEITDVVGNLTGAGPVNIQTASCNHGNCYDTECDAR